MRMWMKLGGLLLILGGLLLGGTTQAATIDLGSLGENEWSGKLRSGDAGDLISDTFEFELEEDLFLTISVIPDSVGIFDGVELEDVFGSTFSFLELPNGSFIYDGALAAGEYSFRVIGEFVGLFGGEYRARVETGDAAPIVPEPATALLLGLGLAGLGLGGRRTRG